MLRDTLKRQNQQINTLPKLLSSNDTRGMYGDKRKRNMKTKMNRKLTLIKDLFD